MGDLIRLNKFLAQYGVSSRRGADELISQGKVSVNSVVVSGMGVQINPNTDIVEVDGKRVGDTREEFVYFAVYKPRGYVSTTTDRFGEQIVTSLVPYSGRLYPVGRLDKDSEGLLILTNDGDFAYKMMHPKYHVPKTYRVLVRGKVNEDILARLRKGVPLEEGTTAECEVKILSSEGGEHWLEFVLHEGKKRQIRRMCAEEHLFVVQLIRVRVGNVELGTLRPGTFKKITKSEIY